MVLSPMFLFCVCGPSSSLLLAQWINVVRTPELAIVRVVMCSVVALVLGSLFWMTDANAKGFGERAAYFAFGEGRHICVCCS